MAFFLEENDTGLQLYKMTNPEGDFRSFVSGGKLASEYLCNNLSLGSRRIPARGHMPTWGFAAGIELLPSTLPSGVMASV